MSPQLQRLALDQLQDARSLVRRRVRRRAAPRLAVGPAAQQPGVGGDAGQRVVELVRDARGELLSDAIFHPHRVLVGVLELAGLFVTRLRA
jgi:hypothetical protein